MIQKKRRRTKPNYFITDDEVKIMWQFSDRWGPKVKMMLGFALFRGLRIGEICAINIMDFQEDFTKLRVLLEKSHIEDTLPLIPELTAMIKEYISKNMHTFKDGYLFPYYTSKKKYPYMSPGSAEDILYKMRRELGKEHESFLDFVEFEGYKRHRIGWHSCRRWFETRLYDHLQDRKKLADIMRYLKVGTVDTYLDPYETWKKEQEFLRNTFTGKIFEMNLASKSQMKLVQFIKA